MSLDRLRYELKLMGGKVTLTPIVSMLSFGLLSLLLVYLRNNSVLPRFLMGGLEMILPLAAGIITVMLTSYDQAIEIQLTVPRLYHLTVLRRLLLLLGWCILVELFTSLIIAMANLSLLHLDLGSWPLVFSFLLAQLGWIAPLAWFVCAGFCLGALLRNWVAGTTVLSAIWLLEILFKDYLKATDWLHSIFFFATTLTPIQLVTSNTFGAWLTARWQMCAIAAALLFIGWLLTHNTEAVLKSSSEA
ncbi:hypothetical protein KSD_89960 [Ktedonobacter sp. SOSP1-85]|uniref:hypothetical protein n=1 Tax=Ktedonobacter sp. SOSP1-85 TaxID=2778367 RepID=UPI001915B372|nr:hypothetical protein [Ktedonobacter sp. SOSP1-85]GHO81225.1 hypothetical protein KSD_89960 [Ktedonobacter sp. SOSP1-85]